MTRDHTVLTLLPQNKSFTHKLIRFSSVMFRLVLSEIFLTSTELLQYVKHCSKHFTHTNPGLGTTLWHRKDYDAPSHTANKQGEQGTQPSPPLRSPCSWPPYCTASVLKCPTKFHVFRATQNRKEIWTK